MTDKKATRIIGIDFGLKRIGVAYSDEMKLIASPLSTVMAQRRSEKTADKVAEELNAFADQRKCEIEAIIVGMPLMMSGASSLLGDEVKHFVELLEQRVPYPVKTWDERLTSVQAERSLREAKMSRKKSSKVVDKVAAVIILQSYLDSIHIGNHDPVF